MDLCETFGSPPVHRQTARANELNLRKHNQYASFIIRSIVVVVVSEKDKLVSIFRLNKGAIRSAERCN